MSKLQMSERVKAVFEDLLINPSVLEENKYGYYFDTVESSKMANLYFGSYQKAFYNEFGKAYFINFKFYDMSLIAPNASSKENLSWTADLQLKTNDLTMNINIFNSDQSLNELESYVAKFFKINGFQNYEYIDEVAEKNHMKAISDAAIAYNFLELDDSIKKPEISKEKKKQKI